MAQAEKRLPPAAGTGNGEPPARRLSTNQAAAALVALINGAEQIPAIAQLRSVVRRACRARIISARGGRSHG
jgi:hypothetical protein